MSSVYQINTKTLWGAAAGFCLASCLIFLAGLLIGMSVADTIPVAPRAPLAQAPAAAEEAPARPAAPEPEPEVLASAEPPIIPVPLSPEAEQPEPAATSPRAEEREVETLAANEEAADPWSEESEETPTPSPSRWGPIWWRTT